MKKNRIFALLLSCLIIASLFSGCSSSKQTAKYTAEAPAMMAESAMDYMASEEMANGSSLSTANRDGGTELPAERKWIVTGNMSVETEDMDSLLFAVKAKVAELGGYIENQDISNGSNYSGRRYRNAYLTVRIPENKLSEFTQAVEESGNVTNQNQSAQDVTLQYIDTESRVNALKTEQARLNELLAKAENLTDLLEIEDRLTEVNYKLESYASQLRSLTNQIDYATIYLNISEVTKYTPVAKPSFFKRISTGFTENALGLWEGIQDITVLLLSSLPTLLVLGAVTFGIVKWILWGSKRRKAKRIAKYGALSQQPTVNRDESKKQ